MSATVIDRRYRRKIRRRDRRSRPTGFGFNLLRDRVEIGPVARFQFGMDEFAIDANFKSTAARRDQLHICNPRYVPNLGRQTDGTRFVVSGRAIFDRYLGLHVVLLSIHPIKQRKLEQVDL